MIRRPPRSTLFPYMFFNDTATTEIYTLSLHDALPIWAKHNIPSSSILFNVGDEKLTTNDDIREFNRLDTPESDRKSNTSELQSRQYLVCRLLLETKIQSRHYLVCRLLLEIKKE